MDLDLDDLLDMEDDSERRSYLKVFAFTRYYLFFPHLQLFFFFPCKTLLTNAKSPPEAVDVSSYLLTVLVSLNVKYSSVMTTDRF